MLRFTCATCSQVHEGMPTFGWPYPVQYLAIPEDDRSKRVVLTADTCVIDDKEFYVRGCIEIHVHDEDEQFTWDVWTSLSEKNFLHFRELLSVEKRAHPGPFFGWLCVSIPTYPDTINLKTMVHLRDSGIRPYVELEPTDHPLAIEQRHGITVERVAEIFARVTHGATTG